MRNYSTKLLLILSLFITNIILSTEISFTDTEINAGESTSIELLFENKVF